MVGRTFPNLSDIPTPPSLQTTGAPLQFGASSTAHPPALPLFATCAARLACAGGAILRPAVRHGWPSHASFAGFNRRISRRRGSFHGGGADPPLLPSSFSRRFLAGGASAMSRRQ